MDILNRNIEAGLGIIAYLTAILFLINEIIPFDISPLYGIFALILLAAAFIVIQPVNKIIISVLCIAAVIISIQQEQQLLTVAASFGTNVNILALFLLIPLVGSYMSYTGYLNQLKEFIVRKSKGNKNHPYRLSFLLMVTAGLILNFGSMAIIRQIADESFRSFRMKKLTLHMMRGFACCMLWSPYFVNVGLVIALFDVSWFTIGGFGFILALIYGALSAAFLPQISFAEEKIIANEEKETNVSSNIKPLLGFTAVFILLSFFVYYAIDVSMITVVSYLAVMMPFIFAAVKKEALGFSHYIGSQITGSFSRLKNELAIFIAAGFFGTALSATTFGEVVTDSLLVWTLGSVLLFTLLIMLVTVLLALVGIHPIIIIIGIGSSISPAAVGISPEYAALLLLVSWTVATQLSPFSGQVLMASRLMNVQPMEITRENAWFVFVSFLILSFTMYSFYFFGWI